MAEATAEETQQAETDQESSGVEVSDAQFPEATDNGNRTGGGQIDILLDATVSVSVCLGEAEVEVRQLLQSGPGSVLQLDKKAGEPVDLYLRGIRFATGNLVVVGDQLGVRIREILSPASEEPPNSTP